MTETAKKAAQNVYLSIQQKSFHNLLKRELVLNFGYSDRVKVADLLVDRMIELMQQYHPDRSRLGPHQLVWVGVSKDDPPAYGKTIADTQQQQMVLDLWTDGEIDQLAEGQVTPTDLLPDRVA